MHFGDRWHDQRRRHAWRRVVIRAAAALTLSCLALPAAGQEGSPAEPEAGPATVARGKVRGRIVSTAGGEGLAFADVRLSGPAGPVAAGWSDENGEFTLDAPEGTYTIAVQLISYQTKVLEGVAVRPGEVITVNVTLLPEALPQKEVVVEGKVSRTSEAALLGEQKRSTTVGDAIGKEQISKTADSDAAEVLHRVTGLTVVGGKYIFVRGLGERYSATQLNGVRLSSPEPNKRVVPLDLFPSDLLDNVTVQKTYTPDQPGDFAGGVVQINTKDFPGKRVYSQSFSTGFNTSATFRGFRSYAGGRYDYLGFDDGVRDVPDLVQRMAGSQTVKQKTIRSGGFTPEEMTSLGRAFSNRWAQSVHDAPPNSGYSVSYGTQARLFGRELGALGAMSYSRGYTTTSDGTSLILRSDAGNLRPEYTYRVDKSTASVLWGTTGNVSYRLTPNHSIILRGNYNRSAEDESRYTEGPNVSRGLYTKGYRELYLERGVLSGTVGGEHRIPGPAKLTLDWKLNASDATRSEPDRRELNYEQDPATGRFSVSGTGTGVMRDYGHLEDHERGAELNARLPLPAGGTRTAVLRLGGALQRKDRESAYRRFTFRPGSMANVFLPPDSLLMPENIGVNLFELREDTRSEDNYSADQSVDAGFAMVDLPLPWRLRLVGGARLEHAVQSVTTFQLFTRQVVARARLDDADWLPAANLIVELSPKMQLRLAASRTVARPDLRELSPQAITDYQGGYRFKGNPGLMRSNISNYDLRWELYPGLGELLAASGFYKLIEDPIERTILGGDAPVISPMNSGDCKNLGAEFEARLDLGRFHRRMNGLGLASNLTLVRSRVRLSSRGLNGTLERPLEGQSPYAANLAVFYASRDGATQASLLWNTFGRRVSEAGVGLPDIYEQPRHAVDATLSQRLPGSLRIKLVGKNLLGAEERNQQAGKVTEIEKPGRSFSLGLSYGS